MNGIPPIKAVMTAFPHSIDVDETVVRAREMMLEHDIRHLPVVDSDELIGLLTDRDVDLALRNDPSGNASIRTIGPRNSHVVELSEPLDRVLAHLAREHVDSVLVVKQGRLAGIFTLTDACRSFAQLLRQLFPRGGDDEAA